MVTAPHSSDDHISFFEALHDDMPERLLLRAEDGSPCVDFSLGHERWREHRIWEGYINASCLLLNEILEESPASRWFIFPAMFNFRHAMEVALKWHIQYAGGTIPKNSGHDLDILIRAFRDTAHGLDEETTYASDYELDLISEIAAIDPRAISFRYPTELNGSPISLPHDAWDLRRLCFTVSYLSVWLDHLSGYIDMSCEDCQTMLREQDSR